MTVPRHLKTGIRNYGTPPRLVPIFGQHYEAILKNVANMQRSGGMKGGNIYIYIYCMVSFRRCHLTDLPVCDEQFPICGNRPLPSKPWSLMVTSMRTEAKVAGPFDHVGLVLNIRQGDTMLRKR